MAEVPPEMARAGVEFAAQEHHDAAKVAAQVDAMKPGAPAAPGEPGAAPDAPAAAAPALPNETTLKLCGALVQVLDRVVVGFTVRELALSPDEREQIAAAAVPVLDKHLPDVLKRLTGTPEGMLLLTVAMIYGSKAPALFLDPPKPTAPPAAPGATA